MLELRNISKRFGDKQILSDFNSTIHEGKSWPSSDLQGGGKTTLLRMLLGLEKIDSGEVFYNGEPLSARRTLKAPTPWIRVPRLPIIPTFIGVRKLNDFTCEDERDASRRSQREGTAHS